MKTAFVDTNILIDILAISHPFFQDAAQLFSLSDGKQISMSVSALSIANISYILRRQLSSANTQAVLRKLCLLITVLPLNDKIIKLALIDEDFTDFEDCLQYYTSLENKQDVIITRNLKDYKKSSLPVMSVAQFIGTL